MFGWSKESIILTLCSPSSLFWYEYLDSLQQVQKIHFQKSMLWKKESGSSGSPYAFVPKGNVLSGSEKYAFAEFPGAWWDPDSITKLTPLSTQLFAAGVVYWKWQGTGTEQFSVYFN